MHTQHAELAELEGHLLREVVVLEPFADVRLDLLVDELADGLRDHPLLVAEKLFEGEEVAGVGGE